MPKLQTYKIYEKTTFKDIIETINNFWDIKDNVENYTIKFIDEEDDIEEIKFEGGILEFLKLRTNIKYAKFIYMNKLGKE